VHDTLDRLLLSDPVGILVSWIDHSLPFHRSANASVLPALLMYLPTAVHASADVHETPAK